MLSAMESRSTHELDCARHFLRWRLQTSHFLDAATCFSFVQATPYCYSHCFANVLRHRRGCTPKLILPPAVVSMASLELRWQWQATPSSSGAFDGAVTSLVLYKSDTDQELYALLLSGHIISDINHHQFGPKHGIRAVTAGTVRRIRCCHLFREWQAASFLLKMPLPIFLARDHAHRRGEMSIAAGCWRGRVDRFYAGGYCYSVQRGCLDSALRVRRIRFISPFVELYYTPRV